LARAHGATNRVGVAHPVNDAGLIKKRGGVVKNNKSEKQVNKYDRKEDMKTRRLISRGIETKSWKGKKSKKSVTVKKRILWLFALNIITIWV
jgi:hypothetical protein